MSMTIPFEYQWCWGCASVLPLTQCAGCPGTLVPLQDSLSLTQKLISSTRVDCHTLVLTSCHVRVHFSSEFLLIFKTYTTVQSYLEMCSSMKDKCCLKLLHPSCSVTFALLLAVKIIETQCWHLPFYWCVLWTFMFSSTYSIVSHSCSYSWNSRKYFEYWDEYLLWSFTS